MRDGIRDEVEAEHLDPRQTTGTIVVDASWLRSVKCRRCGRRLRTEAEQVKVRAWGIGPAPEEIIVCANCA